MEKRIKLYKKRDFSQKINVTIDYIRENFLGLIKPILVIVVPSGILYGVFFSNIFSVFGDFSQNLGRNESETISMIGNLGINYILMMFLQLLVYSLILTTVFTYIKEKDAGRSTEYTDVLKVALGYMPGMVGIGFLSFLVVMFGMIFLFVPGIYLAFTLGLAAPTYVFEEISPMEAFSKSFKLINNKWWSTFGLMTITSMIAGILSYIFMLPTYAVMFGSMFSSIQENPEDPSGIFESMSSWYSSLSLAFTTIGQHLTYLIPVVALAFQYFNLSERLEGTGLKSQIDDFENLA